MNGHIQRAAKKVREARKLLVAAREQAPELDLAEAINESRGVEERAAQLLRVGIQPRGGSR